LYVIFIHAKTDSTDLCFARNVVNSSVKGTVALIKLFEKLNISSIPTCNKGIAVSL
jgi:hypothetical protein